MKQFAYVKSLIYAALFVIVIAIVVYAYWPHKSTQMTIKAQPVMVQVTESKLAIRPDILSSIGVLKASKAVNIVSQTSGIISKVYVKNGQSVSKGELLFQLENRSYQLQLEAAKIQLKQYKNTFEKSKALFEKRVLTEVDYNTALSNYQMQRIDIAKLQKSIEDTMIRAPFSGIIGNLNIVAGSYVAAGDQITTLVNINKLIALYSVPGELYPKLKVGQKIQLSSDAYQGMLYQGVVNFVSPIIDETTNTVTVKALVDNTQHKLTAGMYVTIWQNIGDQLKMIEVPNMALVPTISGNQVYTIENNKVVAKTVKVSAIIGNSAYIQSGLNSGEKVITEGQEKLKNGDLVKVISAG